MSDVKKLNNFNLDEKMEASISNLIEMLEESNERLQVKLAMQESLLAKLKELNK